MKIKSTQLNLAETIKDVLYNRAKMFYEIRDMGDDTMIKL
jgi:hypothetical protein